MSILYIEKLGGLAGFGGSRARIRSRGHIDSATLSTADQNAVSLLFESGSVAAPEKGADYFRFRISRAAAAGTETIEVPEASVPPALVSCVKDEFV